MNAEQIKQQLGLVAHPEGGYYIQTYKSQEMLKRDALDSRYPSPRSAATAIYYLLTSSTFSELHRLRSDEIFHFYMGDPVEQLQLWPDGTSKTLILGTNLERGQTPQLLVPRGVWQGARLLPGGSFALLGCTVAPGFEYEDYESGTRAALTQKYPAQREFIASLTRR